MTNVKKENTYSQGMDNIYGSFLPFKAYRARDAPPV